MSKILAITNVKGGVGKTTTAVNLAAAFTERGRRTLLVDLDPQASLTYSLGFKPEEQPRTIQHLLDADEELLRATILSSPERLDLIPANFELRSLERELESQPTRLFAIRYALKPLRKRYDYILLDCPANAGTLTGAALATADKVIVPLTPDYLAVQVSRSLFKIIQETQKRINPSLELAGIYLTMYDSRTRHARDTLTSLHDVYGPSVPIFSAVVHQSVRLKEAPSVGQSILRYAPRSQAAQAYRVIAHEIEEGIGSAYNFQLAVEPPSQPQDISEPAPLSEVDDILTLDASPAEEPEPLAEVVEAVHAGAAKEPERNWAFSVKEIEPVLQPSSAGNWVQRAGKAGDTDEAIRSLALAVEAEPANEAVRADLEGKLQKRLERAGNGEKTYLAGLGQFLQEHGSPQYAERIVQQTAQLDPVNQAVEPWSDRPAALPEPDAPNKTDGSGMELVPVNAKTALGRAAIKEELKHQAVALVDQAVACSQSGDIQEAHSLFQQSVGLNPRDPRAWVGCARTTDSLPAKISFAKQALKVDPGNPEAQDVLVLASTFMRLSEKERWTFRPDISYSWIVGAIMLLFLLSLLIPMLLRNLVAH